jgi:hypothetical protein
MNQHWKKRSYFQLAITMHKTNQWTQWTTSSRFWKIEQVNMQRLRESDWQKEEEEEEESKGSSG